MLKSLKTLGVGALLVGCQVNSPMPTVVPDQEQAVVAKVDEPSAEPQPTSVQVVVDMSAPKRGVKRGEKVFLGHYTLTAEDGEKLTDKVSFHGFGGVKNLQVWAASEQLALTIPVASDGQNNFGFMSPLNLSPKQEIRLELWGDTRALAIGQELNPMYSGSTGIEKRNGEEVAIIEVALVPLESIKIVS